MQFSDRHIAAAANLYHLARTALDNPSRHARMIWATKHIGTDFNISQALAYKLVCRAVEQG